MSGGYMVLLAGMSMMRAESGEASGGSMGTGWR